VLTLELDRLLNVVENCNSVSGVSWLAVTLRLVLWLDAIAGIIVLLMVVIALNLGDIPFVGTILSFLFLGFLGLACSPAVGLGHVGHGDIGLVCDGASLSPFVPFSTRSPLPSSLDGF